MAIAVNDVNNLPTALFTGFYSAYQDINSRPNTPEDNLSGIYVREITDKNVIDDYWLGNVGKAVKMASDEAASYDQLKTYKAQLTTEVFKVYGFTYDRKQSVDRNVAQYAEKSREIMESLSEVADDEVIALIRNGESGKAHDGVSYFSNKTGDRINDNLLAGNGDSLRGLETDLKAARTYFRTAKVSVPGPNGDETRSANLRANVILAPPQLEDNLLTILRSTGNLGENMNANVINPLGPTYGPGWRLQISNMLPDNDNSWYVFDTTKKPLFWVSQIQPGTGGLTVRMIRDWTEWERRNFVAIGGELWGAAGYGTPISAVKIKN